MGTDWLCSQDQFFDLNQHKDLPLSEFVDALCENFTHYQRHTDGAYQIVPTQKQKDFLQRIITAEESFHFSEVGSGKTKVILPLLCQTFLSNNAEAHHHLARGTAHFCPDILPFRPHVLLLWGSFRSQVTGVFFQTIS